MMNTAIDTGTSELLCRIRDRVAIITLNRPDARNALSDRLTPALRTMIRSCGENPQVGALLITGAGTAFCAGGDVKSMGGNRDNNKLALRYMKDNLDEALAFDFATARDHEAERLVRTTLTNDQREAVQAFIEKRRAVFTGN